MTCFQEYLHRIKTKKVVKSYVYIAEIRIDSLDK